MKTKNLKLGVAMLFILGGVSFSQAQPRNNDQKKPPTFAELLKEMDKNDDGKLAKSELKGALKDDFAKIDTDEDGFITEAELKKAPKPEGGGRKKK